MLNIIKFVLIFCKDTIITKTLKNSKLFLHVSSLMTKLFIGFILFLVFF